MKVPMYSIKGAKKGAVELPVIFSEEYRPDVIARAFHSEQSHSFQPKGTYKRAGLQTSAANYGAGGGISRIPRVKSGPKRSGRPARGHTYRSKGRSFAAAMVAAIRPGVRGGRQAHPPKPEKILVKKINKKEMNKAFKSALSASAKKEIIESRGHKIEGLESFPLVIEDAASEIQKTSDVRKFLVSLGLEKDLIRAENIKVRAGKGKRRGRKYKKPKSALVILHNAANEKPFKNIPGVDAAQVNKLSLSLLAPGASAGRLTLITSTALKQVEVRFGN